MIATRLLLTNRCANMITAWSTNSRMMPLTADFNISLGLNSRSPRSLQSARSSPPAVIRLQYEFGLEQPFASQPAKRQEQSSGRNEACRTEYKRRHVAQADTYEIIGGTPHNVD